jgi:putative ABC transport system ATP-binding protein
MWISGSAWRGVSGGCEMYLIQAHDLYRFYHAGDDETLALRGVSLAVETGELVALMGPSGSGKSTLLACLSGLDEPDGGYVELLGRRLTRRPEAERAAMRAAGVGILLQFGNLFDHLSVEGNIAFHMHLVRRFDARRLNEVIDMVGLAEHRRAYPSQLSGGEAARAGLAVALAPAPPVLLADEPTGEVDAETETWILDLFHAHRSTGGAALIVTHSGAVAAHADRIVCLRDGRFVDA